MLQKGCEMTMTRWSERADKTPKIVGRRGPPTDVNPKRVNMAIAQADRQPEEGLTWSEVKALTGLDTADIKRDIRANTFPPQVDASKGPWAVWRAIDIRDWLVLNNKSLEISEEDGE